MPRAPHAAGTVASAPSPDPCRGSSRNVLARIRAQREPVVSPAGTGSEYGRPRRVSRSAAGGRASQTPRTPRTPSMPRTPPGARAAARETLRERPQGQESQAERLVSRLRRSTPSDRSSGVCQSVRTGGKDGCACGEFAWASSRKAERHDGPESRGVPGRFRRASLPVKGLRIG
jgi:hypothetical protein